MLPYFSCSGDFPEDSLRSESHEKKQAKLNQQSHSIERRLPALVCNVSPSLQYNTTCNGWTDFSACLTKISLCPLSATQQPSVISLHFFAYFFREQKVLTHWALFSLFNYLKVLNFTIAIWLNNRATFRTQVACHDTNAMLMIIMIMTTTQTNISNRT